MELTTSWKEEGKIQGRLEGKVATILRLLNRKFGFLPPEIASQVEVLESDRLDELTEALLDFQTLDELTQWLHS